MLGRVHCEFLRPSVDPPFQLGLRLVPRSILTSTNHIPSQQTLLVLPHYANLAIVSQLNTLCTLNGQCCLLLCLVSTPCALLVALALPPNAQCILSE